jgi:NTE family protein
MNELSKNNARKRVMIALQGGGAHTAYVWGVMDELLKDESIEITAIGGTSGGAMIAAIVASALSTSHSSNGDVLSNSEKRQLARTLLDEFWKHTALLGNYALNPYRFTPNPFFPSWNIDGFPIPVALGAISLVTSPYQRFTGITENPIVKAISKVINFESLGQNDIGPALYVCATNVRTGQATIFEKNKITPRHLLASACLPIVDGAIEIGGEYYWDGGYVADPSISPLVRNHSSHTRDLVIVGVNPIILPHSRLPPDTAWKIMDRINEVTFNSSVISQIKNIEATNELLRQVPDTAEAKKRGGRLHGKNEIFIHYIPPAKSMIDLGVASKNNTSWEFFSYLKSLGQNVAKRWRYGHSESGGAHLLGVSSDTNLNKLFVEPYQPDASPVPTSNDYFIEPVLDVTQGAGRV